MKQLKLKQFMRLTYSGRITLPLPSRRVATPVAYFSTQKRLMGRKSGR